jgi:hypothetical protein
MTSFKQLDKMALAGWFCTVLAFSGTANAFFGTSEPRAKVVHADGTESRFYTTGPAGTSTLRVDVSPTGQVLSRTQVLRDEVFSQIRPGLKASEVFDLIGPPYQKMRFERSKTTAWDYHYRDSWNNDAEFSVIVDDDGIVVGKFSNRTGS